MSQVLWNTADNYHSFSRVHFSTFLKFSGQNIFREWMEILTKNHLEHIIINLYLFVIMTDSMLVL